MDPVAMKERTKQFALRIIKTVDALPNTTSGRAIGNQMVRSGTSVAANYRANCRARSRAEFIAKMGIVEEEADETSFWLELSTDAGLLRKGQTELLLKEANELTAMMAASRITAGRRIRTSANVNRQSNRQSAIGNRQ